MRKAAKKKAEGQKPKAEKPKAPRVDSVIDYPRVVNGETLPSLYDAVADLLPMSSRGTVVKQLSEKYGCAIGTVDRAIGKFRADVAEELAMDRPDRIRRTYEKLHLISRRATREKQYYAAKGALVDAAKLAGDMRPDVLLAAANADMPADVLQALAEEQLAIANRRRAARAA